MSLSNVWVWAILTRWGVSAALPAKLKSLVGKRVEAVGRIDVEAGDSPAPAPGTVTTPTDKVIGRDRVNLSEFEVSTIKEVTGSCPATPSGR